MHLLLCRLLGHPRNVCPFPPSFPGAHALNYWLPDVSFACNPTTWPTFLNQHGTDSAPLSTRLATRRTATHRAVIRRWKLQTLGQNYRAWGALRMDIAWALLWAVYWWRLELVLCFSYQCMAKGVMRNHSYMLFIFFSPIPLYILFFYFFPRICVDIYMGVFFGSPVHFIFLLATHLTMNRDPPPQKKKTPFSFPPKINQKDKTPSKIPRITKCHSSAPFCR